MQPPQPRRKSMRPLDRAPSFVNRPSTSPVHLMVNNDAAKRSKTIGEYARQFSSFTEDGFFPASMDANKAPRGQNEIDKQLLAQQRRLTRLQYSKDADKEHDIVEAELNRVIRQPLIDFLKIPPTIDPHLLSQSILLSSSRAATPSTGAGAILTGMDPSTSSFVGTAAAAASQQSLHVSTGGVSTPHAAAGARKVAAATLSPPSEGLTFIPHAAHNGRTSVVIPTSRPHSALSYGGYPSTPTAFGATAVSSLPLNTPGSRPQTPSVYIGGRMNVDCTSTLSRPTSAAAAAGGAPTSPFVSKLLGTVGGGSTSESQARSGAAATRRNKQPQTTSTTFNGSFNDLGDSFTQNNNSVTFGGGTAGGSGGGHLRLVIQGIGSASRSSSSTPVPTVVTTARAVAGSTTSPATTEVVSPTSVTEISAYGDDERPHNSGIGVRAVSPVSCDGVGDEHASHRYQIHNQSAAPNRAASPSSLMASSPYAHLLQRRPVNELNNSSVTNNSGHQRHQTQLRRLDCFNISMSHISHAPQTALDVDLSALLRTAQINVNADGRSGSQQAHRTGSAASRPSTAGATSSSVAVFPLRTVFLH